MKARSPLALLPFKDQVSKHTTVKWPTEIFSSVPKLKANHYFAWHFKTNIEYPQLFNCGVLDSYFSKKK